MKKKGILYDKASLVQIVDRFGSDFADGRFNFGQNFPAHIRDSVAGTGMFIQQQLREIIPNVLTEAYPDLIATDLFQINNSGAVMQSIIQRIKSFKGAHKITHEDSGTKGVISVDRDAREMIILDYDGTSTYTETDLNRAVLLGESVNDELISGHNYSFKNIIDKVAFQGIANEAGTTITEGLCNRSDVRTNLNLSVISSFATYRTNNNGIGLYHDIAKLYNAMIGEGGQTGAGSQFKPTHIVMPPAEFSIVATMIVKDANSTTGSITVKKMIENNLEVKIVSSVRSVDSSGDALLVMFNNDAKNFQLQIPQPLKFAPIFQKGFDFELLSKFRVAGLGVNYDNAFGYLSGI